MDNAELDKKRFPLSLVPAPRGWHVLISRQNGETNRLLKPGRRPDIETPYLFASQQEAWTYIKALFSFCMKQATAPSAERDKLLNCTQCGHIFRAKTYDACVQCMKDSEFMLKQIWESFYETSDPEISVPDKILNLIRLSEDDFSQIPEAFKVMVQQELAEELEIENRQPTPEQMLRKIIKSRSGLNRPRRIRKAF